MFSLLHLFVGVGFGFDFDDYGYEGEGIVQNLHCTNCGADVEYRVRFDKEDE